MKLIFLFAIFLPCLAFAQENKSVTLSQVQKMIDDSLASKWYEKILLKGYAQFRYNRLGESNKDLTCSSCDRSIGDKQGFFMRRARLVFYGQVSDRVFVYIQPDYATDATNQNYFQIRDAYFDYNLSQNGEFRVRTGISKVPFGFSNLQSSSARGPLDRDDALNTGAPNERDTGVFFMYAPQEIRKRFKELGALKGTGDYGMVAIGGYNGQSLNKREQNNDLHRVVRVTYPWKLENGQFIEASLQAYEGKFFVDNVTEDYLDSRQAASFIVYPQPIGFQVEYNVGVSPEFSPEDNKVETKALKGGYAQINYQLNHGSHRFFPYVRYQEFEGGRKLESAATSRVTEWELGSEWQPNPAFELTAAFAQSDRMIQSSLTNRVSEKGNLIRLQAQFNY
jgi:hypothetical protein